jgi:cytochrome c oxidase subunit 2
VTADEEYIRESIRAPDTKVVSGYEPVMPSFAGQLTESQLNALVTYLKTLEGGPQ